MKWPGPVEGGITYSHAFKWMANDPFRCYLYYGLGLEEEKDIEPNLMWGDTAHVGLEHIIEYPYPLEAFSPTDWEEVKAATKKYMEEEYPTANPGWIHSIWTMLSLYNDSYKQEYGQFKTELELEVPYTTARGVPCTLRGKADGIQLIDQPNPKTKIPEDHLTQHLPQGKYPGDILVEHKFKGRFEPAKELKEIPVDLQTAIYMYCTGARTVIYDVIRIPDTQYSLPNRRIGQTYGSWVKELYTTNTWGDFPICKKLKKWIFQEEFTYTDEDVEHILRTTLDPVVEQMTEWYDYCSQPEFDAFNEEHYNRIFWKKPVRLFEASKTQTYECDYHSYLTNQIDLDELIPVKSFYAELPSG